jgi:Fe-S cluster assembly protein SufB
MSDIKNKSLSTIDQLVSQPYKYGFETTIENERIPIGLDENTIRLLSKKKNEPKFMCKSRLQAFKVWQDLKEPNWAELTHPKIDYQGITYYSAPKRKKKVK